MNMKNEESYRKWIGICQQSTIGPLMMRTTDSHVKISVAGDVLLTLTHDEYKSTDANEILELLGASAEMSKP